MTSQTLSSGIPDTCKWCGQNNSDVVFENANLCSICHKKAVNALRSPKLCNICNILLTNKEAVQELLTEDGFRHSGARHLRSSAENGCGLCRMFLLQDPNTDSGRLEHSLALTALRPKGARLGHDLGSISAGDINGFYFSSMADQFSLELSISAHEDDSAAKYISQRPPEKDLGAEHTTRQVQAWLHDCFRHHQDQVPLLPTRVVDVGTVNVPQAKIFVPTLNTFERYVTLSYCWGTDRFTTTTTTNIELHKQTLDWPTLPQTFKDAIQVTRSLGLRYLWIDALCIIQDSNEDKAKEINKMGNIYSNSTLTIAAVGATRVSEGFLKMKPQLSVDIPYLCPDGCIGSVRVAPQRSVDLWTESLYTRAWCLQENLLSPRLLLYTDTEVVWQCELTPLQRANTNHVAYVGGDPKLGNSPFRRLPADILKPTKSIVEGKENSALVEERYQVWRSLVENYTRRRLTIASDRLPALSGIAQKFEEAWSDEYYAGHWKRHFIPSLSWRRSNITNQRYYAPLSVFRAPSWSWASIDGPIVFDFRSDLGNARNLGAKLISCHLDMESNVNDFVVLEASMVQATEIPEPDNPARGTVYWDDHKEDTWPRFGDRLTELNEEMMRITWCLLLGEGKSGSGKMVKTIALLVMEASEGREPKGAFSRIGLYESSVKGTSKLWVGAEKRKIVNII